MGETKLGNQAETAASDLYWVKSSLSLANGNCVEVARLPDGGVAVRNGRHSGGPVLCFAPDEWHAFIASARAGEFDGLVTT